MFKRVMKLSALLCLLPALFLLGGCDDDCATCEETPDAPNVAYVGSETCADCHQDIYNTFIESGHPYKLTAVPGDTSPVFPWDDQHPGGTSLADAGPPPGTAWTDFVYTIGGYGWKVRFVKPDGLVYTAGTEAQLNLDGDGIERVPYEMDKAKPYNYGCFKCHTTGASPEGSWPEGTEGFGTFVFGGVECEGCHGEGSQHAFEPEKFEMVVDGSPEACGSCHTRDAANRVAVSGGFIKHHEQFDEFIHSPHGALTCSSCHDPHASVRFDSVALGQGVNADCVDCHEGYDVNNAHNGAPDCVDCHMPKAAKSARADNIYQGDISSHTFTINTDPVGKDAMWSSDGKFLALDEFGLGRITLDFACYGCHVDGDGIGGDTASEKSLIELSGLAQGIHDVEAKSVAMKDR